MTARVISINRDSGNLYDFIYVLTVLNRRYFCLLSRRKVLNDAALGRNIGSSLSYFPHVFDTIFKGEGKNVTDIVFTTVTRLKMGKWMFRV